ncbi:hypothetical protein BJF96_g1662 [Verticillium dahliae]|uniref:Uncharacterized protein n=1 Tax=Verticillium dahliae TaxID=27337 RepID=A0AA44WQD2_VERDA|nr:hypothetical protein BJF96_g1662 [Verticillium dahliae]
MGNGQEKASRAAAITSFERSGTSVAWVSSFFLLVLRQTFA